MATKQLVPRQGNHDLYTLADALLPSGATRLMGAAVKDFSYAFLHPALWSCGGAARDWEGRVSWHAGISMDVQSVLRIIAQDFPSGKAIPGSLKGRVTTLKCNSFKPFLLI